MPAKKSLEDISEFEKLFRENFNPLCNKVYRFTLDTETSRDIVQGVFLKLWTQRKTIEITGSAEAYLYRAVINEALNYLKSEKRKFALFDELVRQAGEALNTIEEIVYSKELINRIRHAIDMLPHGCKQVFLLNRYEEMSYKEIAAFLNISVNTVEKQIGKALRILRKHLLSISFL